MNKVKLKAQVLLFMVSLFLFLGIITVTLAALWQNEVASLSVEADAVSALYLAQAGIERAKVAVLYGLWAPGTYTYNDNTDLDVAGDSVQYVYDVEIINSGGTRRTLRGTGKVVAPGGKEKARRVVEVVVDGIEDTMPADGVDDDLLGSPVAWSWREI